MTTTMKRFLIIIEKSGEKYSAYSPDLPECSANGDTPEEARRNIRESVSSHIESLLQDRQPIPEPRCLAEFIDV